MFEFLKTKEFSYVFSFIVGLGLMALFRPICHGDSCVIQKAPPIDEVNRTTYQLGSKCYQFRSVGAECPKEGIVEAFEQCK
jgi:hypothetical protein